jgi:hypothetical protein
MLLDLHVEASVLAPRLDAPSHLLASARATWLGRMVNEHGSARVFEKLAGQVRAAGLDPSLAEKCLVFASEERTHGLLCGAVVEALGGRAVAPALTEEVFPLHEDATPVEGVLRNVLSICCLSETVAVSLIGAERAEMPEGPLRERLTRIWADEVGHARFGWVLAPTLVARMSADEKRRTGKYLRVAFAHLESHELAHLPLHASPPPEGAALGLCSGGDARALLYATVNEVIVPRLDALGLDASRAWRERAA